MKLTEAKIKEAQAVIEAVMEECDFSKILALRGIGFAVQPYGKDTVYNDSLAELYINRLHEINGTEPPPF